MKKWKTVAKLKINPPAGGQKSKIDKIIQILLGNRGLKTKREREEFLSPKLENVTAKNVGIDLKQLKKAIDRIKKAIKNKKQIVVFGDYDVDGICGTAILWESLNSLGANVLPYIPHRIDEGYGLSVKSIQNIRVQPLYEAKQPFGRVQPSLIITVDNGIVANEAVLFAKKQGIDVIITDHHLPPAGGSKNLPKALAIVHTTKICGAGVAWVLSNVILNSFQDPKKIKMPKQVRHDTEKGDHLALVALATIADLVPLLGFNRTLVKLGLEELRKTKRIGLLELFKEAALDQSIIGVYEVGHIIAPRLNAMGRLEYAMDSLRLLCTKDKNRAKMLAEKLGKTNRERQELTEQTANYAKSEVRSQKLEARNLLFLTHESYQQGVIGLVAGKLVEEFYRPTIVVSKGEKYSKASARSVYGFDIIKFIREAEEFLVDVGGHPMAAGFTVETEKLVFLEERLQELAEKMLDSDKLTRILRIDMELPLSYVSPLLYEELQRLAPFGMGNPEPTFVSKGVTINDIRLVGREKNHAKFRFSCHPERSEGSKDSSSLDKLGIQNDITLNAIGFGMGEKAVNVHIGDKVDIVYTIDQDDWLVQRSPAKGEGEVGDGNKRLQLKIKDVKVV